MKIKLVFDDWRKEGKSVYHTSEGIALSNHGFHSGSTWDAAIHLDAWEEKELRKAIEEGYYPVFWVTY